MSISPFGNVCRVQKCCRYYDVISAACASVQSGRQDLRRQRTCITTFLHRYHWQVQRVPAHTWHGIAEVGGGGGWGGWEWTVKIGDRHFVLHDRINYIVLNASMLNNAALSEDYNSVRLIQDITARHVGPADLACICAHRPEEDPLKLLDPLLIQHALCCYLAQVSLEIFHQFGVSAPAINTNGGKRFAPHRVIPNMLQLLQHVHCTTSANRLLIPCKQIQWLCS